LKVLQLVPRLPYPPSDGGKIGILGITRGYVRAGHEVRLFGFDSDGARAAFEQGLAPELAGPYVETMPRSKAVRSALRSAVVRRPFLREKYWSDSMWRHVRAAYEAWRPDLVHLDHSHMGAYGLELKRRWPGARVFLRAHNVEFVIWERLRATATNAPARAFYADQARMVRAYERRLFTTLDGVVALTPVDAARVATESPTANVYTMPAGCELQPAVPLRPDIGADLRLGFVGFLDWIANRDGIGWFVDDVWPRIRARWPRATLDVVGRATSPIQSLLGTEGVRYLGYVEDLEAVLRNVDVAVVPLRIGGGMRIKILDFLSRGLPTVATSVGAEGIPAAWNGQRVLELADDPEAFVGVLEKLAADEVYRSALAAAGRRFVAAEYDWRTLMTRFCEWALDTRAGASAPGARVVAP
jgi:polysaccharide biosynthesis protein PslH